MRFQFGGQEIPRSHRLEQVMEMGDTHSDALVFFGATGDLAYKKIFPALQAMTRRGTLDVPVIGVAKADWTLDQLRARARGQRREARGLDRAAFDKLLGLLRYVDGDYKDAATSRRSAANSATPRTRRITWPSRLALRPGRRTAGRLRLRERARVVVEKPFGEDLASRAT